MKEYREGLNQDYGNKQQMKHMEDVKAYESKNEYKRLCNGRYNRVYIDIENAEREIKNEHDFKQKFIDYDSKQQKINKKFADTVLKDQSRRRRKKEAITDNQPSYVDKLAGETQKYLETKQQKLKSAYQFQKDRIMEKYKKLADLSSNKTKMGENSYKEFQKFKEAENSLKKDRKEKQSEYGKYLKGQMSIRDNQEGNRSQLVVNTKLNRNSSLPMVPGINSSSPFITKNSKLP